MRQGVASGVGMHCNNPSRRLHLGGAITAKACRRRFAGFRVEGMHLYWQNSEQTPR